MEKLYPAPKSIETSPFMCFLKTIRQGSKVLEFGTSIGYMTQYLKEQLGCKVTGIEINPESAALASQHAEKMIVANVDNDPWEEQLDQKFDYILFADVLEHLRDPEKALQKAIRFLSPGGEIITSIPNIGHNAIILSLRKGKFEYNRFGLLDDSHVHFFTWKSIQDIFQRNGLACVEEKDSMRRPGQTEFKEFYLSSPFLSLFLFRKKDGHVYQFICRWKRTEEVTANKPIKRKRVSLFSFPLLCFYDLKDYICYKFNIHFHLLPQKQKTP